MRKTLVIIFLICGMASFASAQKEKKPIDLGVGGGLLFLSESGEAFGSNVTSDYYSYSAHLFMASDINETWGSVVHFSFYAPYAITGTINGDKTDIDMSVYDSIFGIQNAIGFPYYFKKDEKLRLGIGPAFDFLLLSFSMQYANGVGYYLGPGVVFEAQYNFNKSVFANAGIMAFYNFYQFSILNTPGLTESSAGITQSVSVKPYIGIGVTIGNSK